MAELEITHGIIRIDLLELNDCDLTVLDLALCTLKDNPKPLCNRPGLLAARDNLHNLVMRAKSGSGDYS